MTDMNREAQHTPLPWAQSHRRKRTGMYSTQVYCADGETIAEIDWYPRPKDKNGAVSTYREANAAFIVRACNSHYQLVEAVERLLNMPGDIDTECNPPEMQLRVLKERLETWQFARAALSQAGGHNAD